MHKNLRNNQTQYFLGLSSLSCNVLEPLLKWFKFLLTTTFWVQPPCNGQHYQDWEKIEGTYQLKIFQVVFQVIFQSCCQVFQSTHFRKLVCTVFHWVRVHWFWMGLTTMPRCHIHWQRGRKVTRDEETKTFSNMLPCQ